MWVIFRRRRKRRTRRVTVNQIPFEWNEPGEIERPNQVVLEAETTKAVIALMASALVAVVLAGQQAEETADER